MKKMHQTKFSGYQVILLLLSVLFLITGCTASQATALPAVGTVFYQCDTSEEKMCVVEPEVAKAASFYTTPEDATGKPTNHDQYWDYTFQMTMCMADITLMETVDGIWYGYDGGFRSPLTLARCRVNAVYNARPECTLKAGDVVTVGFKTSMYVPIKTAGPLKKGGRYLILAEDMANPGFSGWRHLAGYVQYMAIEDQTVLLEVTGKFGNNPRVDTADMGRIYALDGIPGCENYLEWGTKDVAAFYARTKASEEERLGYTFEYYGTAQSQAE